MTDAQRQALLAATGQAEIPFISEGVESEATGYILSEDALTRLAQSLLEAGANNTALETAQARVTELEGQLQEAQTAQRTAQEQLTEAQNNVQTLQARVEELENEPPTRQTSKNRDAGPNGGVAAHEDPTASFNRLADSLLGAPKTKTADE